MFRQFQFILVIVPFTNNRCIKLQFVNFSWKRGDRIPNKLKCNQSLFNHFLLRNEPIFSKRVLKNVTKTHLVVSQFLLYFKTEGTHCQRNANKNLIIYFRFRVLNFP